jgi:hypothetical protein
MSSNCYKNSAQGQKTKPGASDTCPEKRHGLTIGAFGEEDATSKHPVRKRAVASSTCSILRVWCTNRRALDECLLGTWLCSVIEPRDPAMTEPHKRARRHPKYKTKYRVRNWPEYEKSLRARGEVTLWICDAACGAWTPVAEGTRGGQQRYSDIAWVTTTILAHDDN